MRCITSLARKYLDSDPLGDVNSRAHFFSVSMARSKQAVFRNTRLPTTILGTFEDKAYVRELAYSFGVEF